jgi:uncharacterized protein YraI
MKTKILSLAGGLLLLSAGVACASTATVTNDLNLRSGPGTRYGVIDTLPAGSAVEVLGCNGSWCRVATNEGAGYASASYLDLGGAAYAQAPGPVYVEPQYYDYGWSPGWGPGVGIGIGFGGGWHGGGHWHHHH